MGLSDSSVEALLAVSVLVGAWMSGLNRFRSSISSRILSLNWRYGLIR